MDRRAAAVALLALLAAGACREGVPPFTPSEREVDGQVYALTFGHGQDTDPQWSLSGDTILYHTDASVIVPQSDGVAFTIPADGGTAVPLMPDLQVAGARPFVTPALSPQGDRIAYMDLMSIAPTRACFRADTPDDELERLPRCVSIQPVLDSAVLRVRRVGEQGSIALDPSLPVRFAGPDPAQVAGQAGPWYEQLFPFQAQHRIENAMLFRPSWAPDGERLAFSDGLTLRVWQVGDAAAESIPGTTNGVSAAWSPDGAWIAYVEFARTDSVTYECSCVLGKASETAYRTVYDSVGTLVLVRPDGSERVELGAGEDPAWSPDGEWIYARRDDRIVRMPRGGGAATVVPDTDRGRAPAVSPDGSRLAFSRRKPQLTLDYDIWIVSLVP